MCGNCVTNADAVLVSALGAGNIALSLAQRLGDAVQGRTGAERRIGAHQANAAFLRSLGHDPDQILGPPPLQPARSTARAPRAGALLAT
jgi:hypothetical protein